MAGRAEGESDHGDVSGQARRAARRKAEAWGQSSANPAARPGYPGFSSTRPPRTKGERPRGRRARKRGIPRRPGGGWRAQGSWPRATPQPLGSGRAPWAPRGRAPGPAGARASRLRPASARARAALPPTRRPAGLTRRGGSRPAAPTGAGQGPGTVPSPARSDEPRPPPAVPGRRASPAASAALTSPARGAPSAAAAAGARPVPAAPAAAQPAPPAPGSASRARPLGAGASGQARTEKEGRRWGPLAGAPGPGLRPAPVPEPRRGGLGARQTRPQLREGAAAPGAPHLRPPLLGAPCWREAGSAAERARGSRGAMGGRSGP